MKRYLEILKNRQLVGRWAKYKMLNAALSAIFAIGFSVSASAAPLNAEIINSSDGVAAPGVYATVMSSSVQTERTTNATKTETYSAKTNYNVGASSYEIDAAENLVRKADGYVVASKDKFEVVKNSKDEVTGYKFVREYVIDADKNLVSVANGKIVAAEGQYEEVKNASGVVTSYKCNLPNAVVDSEGNLVRPSSEDVASTQWAAAGDFNPKTDAEGNVTGYGYTTSDFVAGKISAEGGNSVVMAAQAGEKNEIVAGGFGSSIISATGNSKAMGAYSTVIASVQGVAEGTYSSVISSASSTAKGYFTTIYGSTSAQADGTNAGVYSSTNASATGNFVTVSGSSGSTAQGTNTGVYGSTGSSATGNFVTVMGSSNVTATSTNSSVIGSTGTNLGTDATGNAIKSGATSNFATVIGTAGKFQASSVYATIIGGNGAAATGTASAIIGGSNARTEGYNSGVILSTNAAALKEGSAVYNSNGAYAGAVKTTAIDSKTNTNQTVGYGTYATVVGSTAGAISSVNVGNTKGFVTTTQTRNDGSTYTYTSMSGTDNKSFKDIDRVKQYVDMVAPNSGLNGNSTTATSSYLAAVGSNSGVYSSTGAFAGNQHDVVIGSSSSIALGGNSTVMGSVGSYAAGAFSAVISSANSAALNTYSTVLGSSGVTSGTTYSTVIGSVNSLSNGTYSSVIGSQGSVARDVHSTVMGSASSEVYGVYSSAIGTNNAKIYATASTVMGSQNAVVQNGYSGTIIGSSGSATRDTNSGVYSTISGKAAGPNAVVIGSVGGNLGSYYDENGKSQNFTLNEDASKNYGVDGFDKKLVSNATMTGGVAIGPSAGLYSTNSSRAEDNYAVVMGTINGYAKGSSAGVYSSNHSTASGAMNVVIGSSSSSATRGTNTTVIGSTNSHALGNFDVIIGSSSSWAGQPSTTSSWGYGATNSVIIGSTSSRTKGTFTAVYNSATGHAYNCYSTVVGSAGAYATGTTAGIYNSNGAYSTGTGSVIIGSVGNAGSPQFDADGFLTGGVPAGATLVASGSNSAIMSSNASKALDYGSTVIGSVNSTSRGAYSLVMGSQGSLASGPDSAVIASVGSTTWNDPNDQTYMAVASGSNAVVMGSNGGKATGAYATVIGSTGSSIYDPVTKKSTFTGPTASGTNSTVIGSQGAMAQGTFSTIIGSSGSSKATGSNTTVIGALNGTAQSSFASVMGSYNAKATSDSATVIGSSGVWAKGTNATIIGSKGNYSKDADGNETYGTIAQNYGSTVIGSTNAKSMYEGAAVINSHTATNEGHYSVIIGSIQSNILDKNTQNSLGYVSHGALAGIYSSNTSEANGDHAVILGSAASTAERKHSTVIGSHEGLAYADHSGVYTSTNSKALAVNSTVMGSTNSIAGQDTAYGQALNGGQFATVIGSSESSALGTNSTVIGSTMSIAGENHVVGDVGGGEFATVIGSAEGHANNKYATVIGAEKSSAEGVFSSVSGALNSTASGSFATVIGSSDSMAVGAYSAVIASDPSYAEGDFSVVLGSENSTAYGNHSMVLAGVDSAAYNDYDIAIGANTITEKIHNDDGAATNITIWGKTYEFAGVPIEDIGTVSVGAAGNERQIHNVAAGRIAADSTDAINGSQLYAIAEAIKALKQYTGEVVAPAVEPEITPSENAGSNTGSDTPSNTVIGSGDVAGAGAGRADAGNNAGAGTNTGAGANTNVAPNAADADQSMSDIIKEVNEDGSTGRTINQTDYFVSGPKEGDANNVVSNLDVVATDAQGNSSSINFKDTDTQYTIGNITDEEGKVNITLNNNIGGSQTIIKAGLGIVINEENELTATRPFMGDDGVEVVAQTGQIMNIFGEADINNLSDGNIGVVASPDKDNPGLIVKLNKDIEVDTVVINGKDGKDGLTVNGVDGEGGKIGVSGADGAPGIGIDGKDGISIKGEAGNNGISINGKDGKDGKDGVTIYAKDGVDGVDGSEGHIGLNGKDGVTDIKTGKGEPGVDGKDGITRIIYTDPEGGDHEVATLEDGLSFAGDDKKVINKKLNQTLNITGGADGTLTDNNIGVVNDGNGGLSIKLSADLKNMSSTEYVQYDKDGNVVKDGNKTTINSNGVTIEGDKNMSFTNENVSVGGQQIHNVAPGTALDDAVNVSQLNKVSRRVNKVGSRAAALAALHPLEFDPDDKLTFAAGYGNYRGDNSAAIGAFYRPDEKVMFSVAGTLSEHENMINAGVSFSLDRTPRVTNTKTAMAREILDLKDHVAKQDHQIAQLIDLVNRLTGNTTIVKSMATQMFPDVPENHWAYDYIDGLQAAGIIEGYPSGNYDGDRSCTRYEFAAMLYRALKAGQVVPEKLVDEFKDELCRFRVDRVHGDDDKYHKYERIRVNGDRDFNRDTYGSKKPQAVTSRGPQDVYPNYEEVKKTAKEAKKN